MKNIVKELEKQRDKRINENIKSFKEELKESDKLTRVESYTLDRKTPYKRNRVEQVQRRIKEVHNKRLAYKVAQIDHVNAAPDKLPNDLTLIINFYKSNTWGYCPKGSDNYGHETSSITGCGYCKESTATAQLLNQNEIIMKQLYKAKNKPRNLKQSNSDSLGYGSGNGIVPSFEGGVGVSCHVRILEKLGYKVTLTGNNNTTVLTVSNK
ncbi:MAG: hypothetical protein Unbinned1322contig1000_8 [Prokaryotic dsDNA virus sp.]|nr:MAG: hypothetical protein Unbinned1322contig1000_8 [Prokaryotic dsDNA virus sp.]|tara:strand:+ start:2287 stop:2916 length:630 start_codon:yes stop_codon:yes gene_type:complete